MPFGARETLEAHEILTEKKNAIEQLSFYAAQAQAPELRSILENQLGSMKSGYNQMVGYTHDYSAAQAGVPTYQPPQLSPEHIRYGLRHPADQQVQLGGGSAALFSDGQIASYALTCHKNGAKNQMNAALECADPNVRQMMIDGSLSCANQAYELFAYMNRQGSYQIPTMHDHTAKTYLHLYHPVQQEGGPIHY
ncbi:spore coat protein [Paenibacillus pinihumi]|uniref:spore coat protein n=1 Tax=Paenibacillus pinihumi TaxID=669462 RepID=UPI0003F58063|nr:spore coat protein [Paenibacillus pinihumi]